MIIGLFILCFARAHRLPNLENVRILKRSPSAGLVAERALEVRKEGDYWSIYVEGKLVQDGLPSKEIALEVAAAVREVIKPYLGKEVHYFLSPRYAKYVND